MNFPFRRFTTIALILLAAVLLIDLAVRFGPRWLESRPPDPLNPGTSLYTIIAVIIASAGLGIYGLVLHARRFGRTPFLDSFRPGSEPASKLSRELEEMFQGRSNADVMSAVVAALCIHIAKADGRITKDEMDALRSSLDDNFISTVDHTFMARVARTVKEHLQSVYSAHNPRAVRESAAAIMIQYEKHSGHAYKLKDRRDLLRFLALILYETLIADETADPAELELFDFIAGRLGLSKGERESVKQAAWFNHWRRRDDDPAEREARRRRFEEESARRRAKEETRRRKEGGSRRADPGFDPSTWPESEMEQAMRLFGLDRRYTRAELEKAWKKIAMLHHPDRFHSQSPEIRAAANERFIAYRKAHEYLRERV